MDLVMKWNSLRCLLGVALLWAMAGCANLAAIWHPASPQAPANGEKPLARDPRPQPAPALSIPGPPHQPPQNLGIVPITATDPSPFARQAAEPTSARGEAVSLQDLYLKAARRYAGMDTYRMRLKRREVVNGHKRPEEIMLGDFRK